MTTSSDTGKILKLLGHRTRREVLRTALSTGEPVTPVDLADELDEPLGNVSYHVRVLLEVKAVRLVDTVPVRGALQHYYAVGPLIVRQRALVEQLLELKSDD